MIVTTVVLSTPFIFFINITYVFYFKIIATLISWIQLQSSYVFNFYNNWKEINKHSVPFRFGNPQATPQGHLRQQQEFYCRGSQKYAALTRTKNCKYKNKGKY